MTNKNNKTKVAYSIDADIIKKLYQYTHQNFDDKFTMSSVIEEALKEYLDKKTNKK